MYKRQIIFSTKIIGYSKRTVKCPAIQVGIPKRIRNRSLVVILRNIQILVYSAIGIVLAVIAAIIWLLVWHTRYTGRFIGGTVLAVIMIVILAFGGFYINKTRSAISNISGETTEVTQMAVYVKNEPGVGVVADLDGKFKIKVTKNATLIFQSVGMKNVEMLITKNEEKLKIVMKEDETKIDEVVVTGMSSQKKSSRLEGKDLITIGIYTVIYVVIVMLVAMLGFIPIFIPLMAVLCPLIGGIPYMLYVTKAKKFGMTAIMGFLIGLIMVFFGNGYLTMVTGLVGGLLADVILKKADYKSAKSTVLSCGVFSIWVFGNFAPIFLNRESYMVMLTEGYGAEYAATLNTYMPMWIAPILLVACFVFGLVGGVIGKAICKKHFQRAGIA